MSSIWGTVQISPNIIVKNNKIISSWAELRNNTQLLVVANIIDFNNPPVNVKEPKTTKNIEGFSLYQNYPNPFNPVTTIEYTINSLSFVELKVYNVLGKEIANLVSKEQASGNYKIKFNAENLSSGVYFYQLRYNNQFKTKKMLILR